MPAELLVVVKGREEIRQVMDSAGESVRRLSKDVDASGFSLGNLTKKTEFAGMSMGEFKRISRSALYGLDMAFDTAASSVGALDKGLEKAISSGSRVVSAFAFGNVAGVAITLAAMAVGALIAKLNEASEAYKKAIEPYEKYRKELAETDKLSDSLAQSIRERLNVDKESAQNMADLTHKSATYKEAMDARAVVDERMIVQGKKVKDAYDNLQATLEGVANNTIFDASLVDIARAAYESETNTLINLSNNRLADIEGLKQQAAAEKENAANWAATHGVWDSRAEAYKKAADNLKKVVDALKAANAAANATFKGALEKAMTPSEVTNEDVAATQAGKYTNKWDEFRRRAEAVMKGTDPSVYGDQFANMLKSLDMPLDELTRKFKDFSLFADPKNLKLVDWSAMTADVEGQLDAMVGKLNATEVAVQEVWDRLTPEKKEALKKLGISSLDDATKTLLGIKPSALDIIKAPDFDANLLNMQQSILGAIPPELFTTVYVEYKMGTPGGGLKDKPGGGNEGQIGDTANRPTGSGVQMQSGGTGVATRDTWMMIEKGEAYWASGLPWKVQPPGGGETKVFNVNLGMGGGAPKDARKAAYAFMRYLKSRQ
jgi:hypothetical protein